MKKKGLQAAVAVGCALSLGASGVTAPANGDSAPANGDAAAGRTAGATTDHNPLNGAEGFCTWGAQEQIHVHTGYYIKALTGNAETWADQAESAGWTVVSEPQPRSIAVFNSALVGGIGHVAWVDAVNGHYLTITEMNSGFGATAANGFRTTGFHEFDTRTAEAIPGMSYILIP